MPTEEEKAYIVRRAQSYDPRLPLDFDELMHLPMNRVPLGLFNEILESDIIDFDPALYQTQGAPEKKRTKK